MFVFISFFFFVVDVTFIYRLALLLSQGFNDYEVELENRKVLHAYCAFTLLQGVLGSQDDKKQERIVHQYSFAVWLTLLAISFPFFPF